MRCTQEPWVAPFEELLLHLSVFLIRTQLAVQALALSTLVQVAGGELHLLTWRSRHPLQTH